MESPIRAYPLSWPVGWKRTEPAKRKSARFSVKTKGIGYGSRWVTVSDAIGRVTTELRRMGCTQDDLVISTNLPTRLDGLPRSDAAKPGDPGVAVYWRKNGETKCMAIDIYTEVADNLAAVAATLDALRAIERHGGAEILNRAFSGFKALPGAGESSAPSWREVLGLAKGKPTLEDVQLQYKALAKKYHPDIPGTGDAGAFAVIQRAFEMAKQELSIH